MAQNTVEQKIRAGLRITRLITACLPLPIARWIMRVGLKRMELPAGIRREDVVTDGVSGLWLIPDNSLPDRVLLYLHGGGFIYGLSTLHVEMVAYLARKMGTRAMMVDYRLAPDRPFPAALEDCVATYCWLLTQGFAANNIVIAGDSAGGNLTLTTLMKLRDSGDPLPVAAACLSPVADLTNDGRFQKAYDLVLHPRAAHFMSQSYVGSHDARHPLLSPVFGDWHDLPPLLIHAGEDELLCQDAVRVEALTAEAGNEVRLEVYPGMWHVWQIYLGLPQAVHSLDDIAQFLTSHMNETIATTSQSWQLGP